ncbi:MAG TPA: 6-phosphogluconolactonase [Candidatus Saccharimonadales bacterium]
MALNFIDTKDTVEGENELYQTLSSNLSLKKVLWIVSGGSNIAVTTRVMARIDNELSKNLIMILADERYGSEGHPDSNFTQLVDSGFDQKNATFYKTLIDDQSISQTISRIGQAYKRAMNETAMVVGQLGVGDDGHIAGILPGSPVIGLISDVVYFKAEKFKRISLSLEALKSIDIAFVFCFGKNKAKTLKDIERNELEYSQLPAKILQDIKTVYVYNDQLGG